MTSDHSLIERQMADVELRPFTLDDFHQRRRQQQRNRRIGSAVVAVVVAAVVAGGVIHALGSDEETVDTDLVAPVPTSFAGTWRSVDVDGSSQTLEIRLTDADEYEVALHDDAAAPCSETPSTESGRGQVRTGAALVVTLELTCDDGSIVPGGSFGTLRFTHDPVAGVLTDNIGVVWQRVGPGVPSEASGPALDGPSPFAGSWATDGTVDIAAATMEITYLPAEDAYDIVMHGTDPVRCPEGASIITGTGHRDPTAGSRGLARLVIAAALTCDDGRGPVPATPAEVGQLDAFEISFTHDRATDEMAGSLGGTWWREGTEPK